MEDGGTLPGRYQDVLLYSIGFVVVGKVAVFYAFGLYQKWWRFIGSRDMLRILQAVAVSSLLLVLAMASALAASGTKATRCLTLTGACDAWRHGSRKPWK